jgi:putative membrane protein
LIPLSQLPTVNAALCSLSAVFLFAGFLFIRSRNRSAHRACMLAACASSALFLISYLVYHYQVGSVPFKGAGAVRVVYFAILISHDTRGGRSAAGADHAHCALRERLTHTGRSRWSLPIWLYVSVTASLSTRCCTDLAGW